VAEILPVISKSNWENLENPPDFLEDVGHHIDFGLNAELVGAIARRSVDTP
jgi:hypothetical protein